jgi:hypothetical protein
LCGLKTVFFSASSFVYVRRNRFGLHGNSIASSLDTRALAGLGLKVFAVGDRV